MKKNHFMSWHSYFMSVALLSSFRSKDGKTQNGACIVDPNNKIIGIGYNGLPRGCDDNDPQFWEDEDDSNLLSSKHTYVVHAEKNAIYNCMAHDLSAARLYTTQFPCNICAQAIIQVGISEVIFLRQKQHSTHLLLNLAVSKMFTAANVKVTAFSDITIADAGFLEQLQSLGEMTFPD